MLPGEKGVEDTVSNSFSRIHSEVGIIEEENEKQDHHRKYDTSFGQ